MILKRQIARHLDLERLFGSDLLPVLRVHPRSSPPKASLPVRRTVVTPSQTESIPPEFQAFRDQVMACTKCSLCETRTQVVFGVGTLKAPVLFVGEGPGEEEDKRGEPFVGRAGQLLTKTLAKFNVSRSQVYIANIVKCRPPGNRAPRPEEMLACMPYLLKQIQWIRPKVVCALGGVAATTLLDTKLGITRLRGRFHDFNAMRIFPTFHPAYILRNMGDLPVFENDLKHVLKDVGLLRSPP